MWTDYSYIPDTEEEEPIEYVSDMEYSESRED